ncbi:MAG: Zn-dependent hydrolase [Gemmatimonadetes bacterium]|nr:MAG: Zn-dependent hydrolase [Gemmatimonadota bacterium]
MRTWSTLAIILATSFAACQSPDAPTAVPLDQYATVRLTADVSSLSDNQRAMLGLLIEAATAMDDIYWQQAYGNRDSLLSSLDGATRQYAGINYGPWDRLAGNAPFLDGVGAKPAGANFYPSDMTRDELNAAARAAPDNGAALLSLYTLVRRDESGELYTIPFHEAYAEPTRWAAAKLQQAAMLAESQSFSQYLVLRAEALLSDEYQASDLAWMDMKDNAVELVIGPIETYEDELFGAKAAHEAYVLLKDLEWSKRLTRVAEFLPSLQDGLPVDAAYKTERPGTDADLGAYDAIYYAGQANAGSKTIAINLPNDEAVQLQKGTRRLQLKNTIQAKFDRILLPIAGVLIAGDQRRHITFDAFFENTMYHEVAHGLGIKHTITDRGTVREALLEQASALEEGKADVLGLYMITALHQQGEMGERDLRDNYVTFLASIFRSVRFGAASAHGRANVVRFNFFRDMDAFSRDDASGTYRVDFGKMEEAVDALSQRILTFQGDGDYQGVVAFMDEMGTVGEELRGDLDRLGEAGIPVDIVFEQGPAVLGL